MSKGAVIHHFHLKEGVIKALLDQQADYLDDFAHRYVAKHELQPLQTDSCANDSARRVTVQRSLRSIPFQLTSLKLTYKEDTVEERVIRFKAHYCNECQNNAQGN